MKSANNIFKVMFLASLVVSSSVVTAADSPVPFWFDIKALSKLDPWQAFSNIVGGWCVSARERVMQDPTQAVMIGGGVTLGALALGLTVRAARGNASRSQEITDVVPFDNAEMKWRYDRFPSYTYIEAFLTDANAVARLMAAQTYEHHAVMVQELEDVRNDRLTARILQGALAQIQANPAYVKTLLQGEHFVRRFANAHKASSTEVTEQIRAALLAGLQVYSNELILTAGFAAKVTALQELVAFVA